MGRRAGARRAPHADDFIRKRNALPDQISGLDTIMADAVAYKFIPAPLGGERIKTLIQPQAPIK